MARRIFLAAILIGALAAMVAGCGGDKKNTSKPPAPTFDIRPGIWSLQYTTTWSGADSCTARSPQSGSFPDTVLCSFDVSGGGSLGFECDNTVDGNRTTFSCTALLEDLDPCKFLAHLEGEGTVFDDDSLAITASMWFELSGPDDPCNLYQNLFDPCTENLQITGRWVSPDTSGQCQDTTAAPSVRAMLETVAAEAFARR